MMEAFEIDLIDTWFERRFPNEEVGGGYYNSWIKRFERSTIHAMYLMDKGSVELFVKCLMEK